MKRNKIIMVIFAAILGMGLVLGDLSLVKAQETEEFTLEEIIVTAQKREQDLQKVPIAMSSLDGGDIADMGGTTLKEALSTLSSVVITGTNEALTVSIRGMDNDGMPGDSVGMVAVNLDGVFSNNAATGYSGLYDISRVEVMAGPQGTLYSRNSGGGVVNMVTNDPALERFDASGLLEIASYNTLNTQGVINLPTNEKSALRLAFSTTDRDGYNDNGTDDNDSKSMRFKYLYNFNEDLSAVLAYENTRSSGKGQGRGQGTKQFGYEDDATYPDGTPLEDPWTGLYPGELFYSDINGKKYYMTFTWDTGIGTLTFQPHYSDVKRLMGTPMLNRMTGELETQHLNGYEKETSAELRMNSSEDSFATWVAGFYYYKKKWRDDCHSVYEDNFNRLNNPSQAIFANLTYPVTDRFRVTGGGRYTKDHERMEFVIIGNLPTPHVTGEEHWDKKTSHFDYKLGIEYDISEHSMLWLENSTGYRQGYRGQESQTLDAYQLGSKNRFLDQRLQVNAAAFYYDYSNYQGRSMQEYVNPDTGEVFMDMGTGTGDATVYGFDLDTNFLLTRNDYITFSASYLHSEIRDLVLEYLYSPPSALWDESPINNSPEWTLTGSYKHHFYLGNGGTLTPGFDIRYRTEYFCSFQEFINDPDNPVNIEPDHYMIDASLNYASPSGKWSINAYVRNIENHAEKIGVSMSTLKLSAPRTFGAVLSLRF